MAVGEGQGVRRRCPQCQQVKRYKRRRHGVCSVACEVARRKASGVYLKCAAKAAETRGRFPTAPAEIAGFGALTERERGIYMRARENALSYAADKARRLHRQWLAASRIA